MLLLGKSGVFHNRRNASSRLLLFFFFSSRRRHTRLQGDWSSDVCSSDLREADGEWFAYVEDMERRCLAGYTVFNRLVEVDKRTDRRVRSPHSRFAPHYQRRGIASAVYRSVLDKGTCLVSGARQSPGAHGLWNHRARSYDGRYVGIGDSKSLIHLGRNVPDDVMDRLSTRRMLLGAGWTVESFAQAVRMQLPG